MKKYTLCIVAIAILMTTPAVAQEADAPELDSKVCQQMSAYQPDDDQGAEYEPGVDVHGRPVVEADLNPSPVKIPDTVKFDVTVDLAKFAGIAVPEGTEDKAVLGQVTVDKEGHMTFNGQPIEGDAEAALRTLCDPEPDGDEPGKQE
ncbi:MAG: hypothetical protein ACAH83_11960 [Alphaproteobacteria bacterium]